MDTVTEAGRTLTANSKDGVGFVAVHAGAGYHSSSLEGRYKNTCRVACIQAMDAVKGGKSAVDVVSEAVTCLEDSLWTNAGTGANLTISGEVECDASIMDGCSQGFGAVGALKETKNPIKVARALLKEELKGPLTYGRIPPLFLVGEGARRWASEHGIPSCTADSLRTDRSVAAFKKYMGRVLKANTHDHVADTPTKRCKLEDMCNLGDTVGAVCLDDRGHLAAAVSSGGIALKCPGRVGQAAVYGSGCWAVNSCTVDDTVGAACCTTGCGEHLIKTLLAKVCAEKARDSDGVSAVEEALGKNFLDSSCLQSVERKLGGVLLLKFLERRTANEGNVLGRVELAWGHTTDSMCVGYMGRHDTAPTVEISRLSQQGTGNSSPLFIQGIVKRQARIS